MNDKETLFLENDLLQLCILPAFGGKISSFRSVRTGDELLLPPLQSYNRVASTADFSKSDGGGFDECLPSVASCETIHDELAVSDHGDLWRQRWQIDSVDEVSITLHADCISRPLRLARRASLNSSCLTLDYELTNLSEAPATWLWSAHPLLRVEAGDRIVLPEEIDEIEVEYSSVDFEAKRSIRWPIAKSRSGAEIDLSLVHKRDNLTAHKLFAHMKTSGWCGLYRQKTHQGITMRFDSSALPYLGLWICSGAWPESSGEKQYTVALEPTVANVDSLVCAMQNGTVRQLGGRERYQWQIELEVLGASSPVGYEDFCKGALAGSSSL